MPSEEKAESRPQPEITLDAPYITEGIKLVKTYSSGSFILEFFRNYAYTCGVSGYQTFLIAYPADISVDEEHPLWVRMHGGGAGAFVEGGRYAPSYFFPESLDEEEASELASLLDEGGLVSRVKTHPAGFRFLFPSMCDHDFYSGAGIPEKDNPFSPDENGATRAADGLLATKAAIAYTTGQFPTTHIFLHGTSAGSIGAATVAYSFEREGFLITGIVMDSGVLDPSFDEVLVTVGKTNPSACAFDAGIALSSLVGGKVGPALEEENMPATLVFQGKLTVPMLHVWNRGDPTFCGESPIAGMAASDYVNEGLRKAIDGRRGSSRNLRLCVSAPGAAEPCTVHSPTKYDLHDTETNLDYNSYIMGWVDMLLQSPIARGYLYED